MHVAHFEFVNSAPSKLDLWYDRVFAFLNKFDRKARDEALSRHYLAYDMTFAEEVATSDEAMDDRFRCFRTAFQEGNQRCKFEELATYGLLCAILGHLHRKSGVESLRGVIEMHKGSISDSKQILADEEFAAHIPLSWIRESSEKILNLYDEIDSYARGYVDFCEQVIRPLLAEANEDELAARAGIKS